MNPDSRQRLAWARSIARVYAGHPDVGAILLGGSTARGEAARDSDIDLGVFWMRLAPEEERRELLRRAGGSLRRSVPNHLRFQAGVPRQLGCIEIAEFTPNPNEAHRIELDLEHETVAGTERALALVMQEGEASLELQELVAVIQEGVPLHGHDLLDRWQESSRDYPEELALRMVTENISGIGRLLTTQLGWIETQDWLCLQNGFLQIGRRLLLCLMGLNRAWAFTDNPNFKGLKPFTDRLQLKPDRFAERLGESMQGSAHDGIRSFADLSEEVLELVELHMPSVETPREREALAEARRNLTGSGG